VKYRCIQFFSVVRVIIVPDATLMIKLNCQLGYASRWGVQALIYTSLFTIKMVVQFI